MSDADIHSDKDFVMVEGSIKTVLQIGRTDDKSKSLTENTEQGTIPNKSELTLVDVCGLKLLKLFHCNEEYLQQIINMTIYNDDIWIIGYPRSGNKFLLIHSNVKLVSH